LRPEAFLSYRDGGDEKHKSNNRTVFALKLTGHIKMGEVFRVTYVRIPPRIIAMNRLKLDFLLN
jgi:hypothetical protein